MTHFYSFSGGMESAAMVYLCRDEIREQKAHVMYADTGKQFPEMDGSLEQIEGICGFKIVRVKAAMTFDEYLFERGGMLKQGFNDCSRRMKRRPLKVYVDSFPKPHRIALGFNADEVDRGTDFCARNDTDDRRYWFPLQDRNVDRAESVKVCERAGFSILLAMYRKMGRFDCFFCPNQRISQAERVMRHYPEKWEEWKRIEERKGHHILKLSAKAIESRSAQDDFLAALDRKQACACMGDDGPLDD